MHFIIYLNLFWLLLVTFWAILHAQKSVTTWERFKKIETRLSKLEESKWLLDTAKGVAKED